MSLCKATIVSGQWPADSRIEVFVTNTDFLIIGGGIIGLTIARELQRRNPAASVIILEKETTPGQHASGRNSGVLHSGIYYTADSLKARFTRDGNQEWQSYCEEYDLPLDRCGKLVVTRSIDELSGLDILEQRGKDNGVQVQRLDETEMCAIEPGAITVGQALFIPSTATVDPVKLVQAQQHDFLKQGGQLLCNHPYHTYQGKNTVEAGGERLSAGHIINCAGLYADRVARDFGFSQHYTMLPFKGLYLYADDAAKSPRTHIYPVPDLRNPFLGVHVTRTVDGRTKIGPTAIPALWREHYGGVGGFNFRELFAIAARELQLFVSNHNGFRRLALSELCKQRKGVMVKEAGELMKDTESLGPYRWGRPGNRAQLLDTRTQTLVMDFVIEGDKDSTHVLNAVSPAFTCALPFARHVIDTMENIAA